MEETLKKRIGILTTFYAWDKAYSLTSVVESQLISLVKYRYNPVLFVHDNFKGDELVPTGVEIRKVIPRFPLVDYSNNGNLQEGFWLQVEKAQEAFNKNMQDIDVALTHDLIFQGWFLPYNVAMRQSNVGCRWFHWIHSAPSPRPDKLEYPFDARYRTMPNSKLIYMNDYDTLRLAEMYGGTLDDVRVIYNPLDPRIFFDLHPFVSKLIDKYRLLEADIIDVYPVSSTRFDGKQVDKVITIMAELKKQGKSVRFICPNAHANAQREKDSIEKMILFGLSKGLTREEIIFTSLEDKQYELGVPHNIVRDLFQLSNLFVFPTQSENCPLILLEAAMSKCLLVLNDSFQPLKTFVGKDALYFKFGSLTENVSYSNEEKYFQDVAIIIIGELNKNRPLNAFNTIKKKFNMDYVFKNQLEPTLMEKWD